ncbi:MAG: hypothetical protein KDI79_25060 [Anaerolineae bacterium]|nr:hypothetical protein [Anaerolineae bacterium]
MISSPLFAQSDFYTHPHFTIDSGGGQSSGGGFTLIGTIGQPEVSSTAMSGGGYTLTGGFWGGSGGNTSLLNSEEGNVDSIYLPLIVRDK